MSVRLTHDGRTILKGTDYSKFRESIWRRDMGRCVRCTRPVSLVIWGNDSDMHLHHRNGRGMGGSLHNDVSEEVETLCSVCHRIEHGQQSAVPSELKWSRA
jgi:5-methylcytosine-specific restriction endonuclease McrA